MTGLTHFDAKGAAHMVDVSAKPVTDRIAVAEGHVVMDPATLALITEGRATKGDVIQVARLAGIMGAKRTPDLIPLCHPLALTHIRLDLEPDLAGSRVICQARVETQGQTGVEMEALCAVQVALLTIYDMCKAVDRGMSIEAVRLVEKAGGKSGPWRRGEADTDAGTSTTTSTTNTTSTSAAPKAASGPVPETATAVATAAAQGRGQVPFTP